MPDAKFTPNPSTYKQVIANMQAIQDTVTKLGDLDKLDDNLIETLGKLNLTLSTISKNINTMSKTISDLDKKTDELDKTVNQPPETGGIVNTDDGMKVVGVHVNTESSDVNTTINTYVQGVTWEFKKASVIGLSGKPGVVDPYVAVMTVKRDTPLEGEPSTLDTTDFQIAYGSEGLNIYRRPAISDTKWGDWKGLEIDNSKQIIESTTQPTNQKAGDYWAEPIE